MGKQSIIRILLTLFFSGLTYIIFVSIHSIDEHKFADAVRRIQLSELEMKNATPADMVAAKMLHTREMDEYKSAFITVQMPQLRVLVVAFVNLIAVIIVIWWPSKKMQNKAEMATPRKPSDQF